jgi:hypothetical protein
LKTLNTHYSNGWRPFHLIAEGLFGTYIPYLLDNSAHHDQPYLFLNELSLSEDLNDSNVLAYLFKHPKVVATINKNMGNEYEIKVRDQMLILKFQNFFEDVTNENERENLRTFAKLCQIPLPEPNPQVD